MPTEYNPKSPSVKRIFREMKEMNAIMEEQKNGRAQFAAEALESDIFEWHFAVRGPDGTDYESGIYHGRILLPHDYPFKPPSFIMLTPVRFGT
jgi:ubiquitin-conjugating enzyme E2 J1